MPAFQRRCAPFGDATIVDIPRRLRAVLAEIVVLPVDCNHGLASCFVQSVGRLGDARPSGDIMYPACQLDSAGRMEIGSRGWYVAGLEWRSWCSSECETVDGRLSVASGPTVQPRA